jgi:hypothetical protein
MSSRWRRFSISFITAGGGALSAIFWLGCYASIHSDLQQAALNEPIPV